MLKQLIKIFLGTTAALLLAITVLLAWFSGYIDSQTFREDFTSNLSSTLGCPVVLEGDIDVEFFPWIGLRITDVTLLGAEPFADSAFIRIKGASFGLDLLSLLQKRFELQTIHIEGVRVFLTRSAQGKTNWAGFLQKKHSAENVPLLSEHHIFVHGIRITDAEVTWNDLRGRQQATFKGLSAHCGAFTLGEPVGVSLKGIFRPQGSSFSIEAVASGRLHTDFSSQSRDFGNITLEMNIKDGFLPPGRPIKGLAKLMYNAQADELALEEVYFRHGPIRVEGSARIANPFGDFAANGTLALARFSLNDLFPPAATGSSPRAKQKVVPCSASLQFNAKENGVTVKLSSLMVGNAAVNGSIALRDYTAPKLDLSLVADSLRVDSFAPLFGGKKTAVWRDLHLPLWQKINAKGDIVIKSLSFGDREFLQTGISFAADNGRINATITGNPFGGKIDSTVKAAVTKGVNPALDISVASKAVGVKLSDSALLAGDWGRASGTANAEVLCSVKEKQCLPHQPISSILNSVQTKFLFFSPQVELSSGTVGEKQVFQDVTIEGVLGRSGGDATDFLFDTDVHIQAAKERGGKSFSATVKGPLLLDRKAKNISSSGLQTTVADTGFWLPSSAVPATMGARIAWDKAFSQFHLDAIEATAWGMKAKGNMTISRSADEKLAYRGRIDMDNADIKGALYKAKVDMYAMADKQALRQFSLHGDFHGGADWVVFDSLAMKLDDTPITGKLRLIPQQKPRFEFDLVLGTLDLDRYLPPARKTDLAKLRAGTLERLAPVDLPFQTLRWLDLHGPVSIEKFILEGVVVEGMRAHLSAHNGELGVSSLSGHFYGGSVQGEGTGTVLENQFKTAIDLQLKDFAAGPMLKDVAGRDYVRGKTNAQITLQSFGRTDDDIIANLDGAIGFNIVDGSYKFSNWSRTDALGPGERERALQQRTGFKTAVSRWTIRDGHFILSGLDVDSSLMQITGDGMFSPPQETIDLRFKADFASVPSVTFHVVGHLKDPQVEMPGDKIVTDTIKNLLGLPLRSFRFFRDLFF